MPLHNSLLLACSSSFDLSDGPGVAVASGSRVVALVGAVVVAGALFELLGKAAGDVVVVGGGVDVVVPGVVVAMADIVVAMVVVVVSDGVVVVSSDRGSL